MPLEDMVDEDDELVIVDSPPRNSPRNNGSNAGHSWVLWLLGLVGACLVGLVVFAGQDTKLVSTAQDVSTKPQQHQLQTNSDACTNLCFTIFNNSTEHPTRRLLQRAQAAKEQAVAQLKVQYGEEYFDKLFLTESDESIGKTAVVSPDFDPAKPNETNVSQTRFVRKLMLKVLTVLLQHESCRCGIGLKQSARSLQDAAFPTRFVWVTGGHSAAAGHGNFYEESYTAVMERTSQKMFRSVGIDLEGRNYAMGGMNSAPELALCAEAVYGVDADVVTWDYGMTDGRGWWRKGFYGSRIGVHRNRPALVEFGMTSRPVVSTPRLGQLASLQSIGLTGLYLHYDLFDRQDIRDKLPDMQTIKTQEEMDALAEFVRHFKCGPAGIEEGDPTCGANKFTKTTCPMSGRARWHPGWKAHAFVGNVLAMFMMDALLEALETLVAYFEEDEKQTIQSLFDTIQQQEDDDYSLFFNTNVTEVDPDFLQQETAQELNASIFYRNRALCHTALLPSKTRYLGILTDNRNESSSFEHYEMGVDFRQDATNNSSWRLVYDQNEHNKNKDCPKLEHLDYKDWFYVQTQNGKTTLTIPNRAEQEVYLDNHKLRSYVVMCMVTCPWGKCAKGTITWQHVNDGNATLWVNDETVTEVRNAGGCVLLKGEKGYSWKADENGQFKISAQVHPPDSFMKISSVIIL